MFSDRDPAVAPDDFPALVAALRAGTANDSDARRAALDLLCWHETWLRRQDFRLACIQFDCDEDGNDVTTSAAINWHRARVYRDAAPARASQSNMTVLSAAILLATDDLGLACLGNVHRWRMASAFATALGYTLAEPEPVNHNHPAFTGTEPGCPACIRTVALDEPPVPRPRLRGSDDA